MEKIILDKDGKPWYSVEVTSDPNPLRGAVENVASAATSISNVGDIIAQSSRDILESMKQGLGESTPDEVELEFGVSLKGDFGIPIIAKASGEATFKVRIAWKPDA